MRRREIGNSCCFRKTNVEKYLLPNILFCLFIYSITEQELGIREMRLRVMLPRPFRGSLNESKRLSSQLTKIIFFSKILTPGILLKKKYGKLLKNIFFRESTIRIFQEWLLKYFLIEQFIYLYVYLFDYQMDGLHLDFFFLYCKFATWSSI